MNQENGPEVLSGSDSEGEDLKYNVPQISTTETENNLQEPVSPKSPEVISPRIVSPADKSDEDTPGSEVSWLDVLRSLDDDDDGGTPSVVGGGSKATKKKKKKVVLNLQGKVRSGDFMSHLKKNELEPDQVKCLMLSRNKIEKLMEVDSFPNFISLTVLDLSFNNLRVLPIEVTSLKNLKKLYINNNQIQNLPVQLPSLTQLTTFLLHDNPLQFPPLHICLSGLEEIKRFMEPWTRLNPATTKTTANPSFNEKKFLFLKKERHVKSVLLAEPGVALDANRRPYMQDRHTIIGNLNRDGKLTMAIEHIYKSASKLTLINQDEIKPGAGPITPPINEESFSQAVIQSGETPSSVPIGYYGVFDGHGTEIIADYCARHMHNIFISQAMKNPDLSVQQLLENTFLECERRIINTYQNQDVGGTTATVILLIGHDLHIAHVGDSTAVLSKRKKSVLLTPLHNMGNKSEFQRVAAIPGVQLLQTAEYPRVIARDRSLAVTRSLGDKPFKDTQAVIAVPEYRKIRLSTDNEVLVIASDGLWDIVKEEEAIECVYNIVDPSVAAHTLLARAMSAVEEYNDNIVIIVIRLQWLFQA